MHRKEVLEWAAALLIVLVGLSLWVLLLKDNLHRVALSSCGPAVIQPPHKENP